MRLRARVLAGLAACAVLWLGAGRAPAADADAPRDHLDAYVLMVQADQARDRGEFKPSVKGYREALLLYARLAREKPDWNPDAVKFRMSYCAGEIEKILRQTGKTEDQILNEPDASASGEVAAARAMYLNLLREHEALKQQVASARNQQAASAQMVADAEATMKKLTESNRALQTQLGEAQAAAAAAVAGSSNRMEQLVAEVARLEVLLARAREEANGTAMQGTRHAEEAAALRTQVGQLQAALKASPTGEVERLRRDLGAAQADLARAQDEMKQARTQAAAMAQKDVAAAQKRAGDAEAELQRARTETAELQRKLAAAAMPPPVDAKKLKQAEADLAAAQAELQALRKSDEARRDAQRELEKLRGDAAARESALAKALAEAADLKRILAASGADAGETWRAKAAKLEKDLAAAREGSARVEKAYADKADQAAAEIRQLKSQVAALEQAGARAAQERAVLQKDLAAARAAVTNEAARVAGREMQSLQDQLAQARRVGEALRETVTMRDGELAAAVEREKALSAEVRKGQSAVDEVRRLQRELDKAVNENRVAKLEKLVGDLRAQLDAAQQQLDKAGRK